jgi:hypothetical protein
VILAQQPREPVTAGQRQPAGGVRIAHTGSRGLARCPRITARAAAACWACRPTPQHPAVGPCAR